MLYFLRELFIISNMKYGIHSLAFKQSVMILLGITIVFGILYFSVRSAIGNQVASLLMKRGTEISEKNLNLIDNIFTDSEIIGENVRNILGRQKPDAEHLPKVLSELLISAREKVPQVVAVVVAVNPEFFGNEYMRLATFENGKVQVINGENYTDKPWFESAKKAGRPIWQEPFVGNFINEPIAVYTIPYYMPDKNGKLVFGGVICIDISLAFLDEKIQSIHVDNGGYSFILSPKGMVVAHPRKDWIYKENLESLAQKHVTLNGLNDAFKKEGSGLFMGDGVNGEEICVYFNQMKVEGWTFGIVWPAQKFFEDLRKMRMYFIKFSIGGYLIMLLIVLCISFRVARPLNRMSKIAHDLGKGRFDVAIPTIPGRDEIAQFAQAFNKMRESLDEYVKDLKEVTEKNFRMESELSVARNIQLGVLPKDEDEESMRDGRHEIAAYLLPAREVGGDFYDFYSLDENHIVISIADVSGKGVPAALFMMSARTQLKSLALAGNSVDDVFNKANARLAHKNDSEMFVTVWMGIVDLRTGHVDFCCAGHNPPVVRHRNGDVEFVKCRAGLVMAGMETTKYRVQSLDLRPGDILFLYTDGCTEAIDASETLFGDNRLLSSLKKADGIPVSGLCAFVKSELDEFVCDAPQFDDITMLVLKYNGPNSAGKA